MYTITKIEEQKKDEKRCSVFVNGQFSFGITVKAVERYGLKEDLVFDEEGYSQLLQKIQLDKAKYHGMSYLASHAKTEKQVRDKLIKYEYNEMIIDRVIDFLKKYHYIDDENYSKRYAYSKAKYYHKSVRQIQSGLYLKGIVGYPLYELVEELEELEEENIGYFLKKYKYNKELTYEEKRKITNKLLTRGFIYEKIRKNMEQIDEIT